MITDPPCTAYIFENLLLLFVTSLPIISSRSHVRIHVLHVPSPAATGDSVPLRCHYELEDEALYAVKWYKDGAEFFRYVPAARPPLKLFPRAGVDVDMSKSDSSTVYLRNLSLDSYGNYTCQVSTDRPFFRCVQTTRQLEVVVPPSDGPILMEDKSDYELGDNVSILCNSGRSKPAPELRWYINDQLAVSELSDQQETVVYPDSLESSSLTLRFRLRPDVFRDGKVVLKCVASVSHIHAETTREIRAAGNLQVKAATSLVWMAVILALRLQLNSVPLV